MAPRIENSFPSDSLIAVTHHRHRHPRASRDSVRGVACFRRGRALRAFAAILGFAALLAQVSLPWLSYPAVAASGSRGTASMAALSDTGLVLCSAHVAAQSHTNAPGDKPLSENPASCPVCLALHLLSSAVPPTNAVLLAGSALDVPYISAGHKSISAQPLRAPAQPRAPPARLT